MNCREVKKYLEQYADNASGLGMKRNIKEHIAACGSCMNELDDLISYKKKMTALKKHKAPSGFLDEINRRIDEPSFFRKTANVLFFPLKNKIPLEAAGALALVFIIVYMFRPAEYPAQKTFPVARMDKSESSNKLRDMDDKERSKAAESIGPSAGLASKYDIEKVQPALIAENKTRAPKIKKIFVPGSYTGNAYEIALLVVPQSPELYSEAGKDGLDSDRIASSRSTEDEKTLSGGAPPMIYGSRKKSADAAEPSKEEQTKSEEETPADMAKISAPAEKPQMETIDGIKAATAKLGGKILSGKYNNQTKEMEYIILEIPAGKYHEFVNRLKKMGTLQNEPPEKAQKGSRMQRVKVLLINQ